MNPQTQNTSPQVAVVMPSFNAAETILDSIASVQRQTLTDWEMVIVDDSSTDDTVALV